MTDQKGLMDALARVEMSLDDVAATVDLHRGTLFRVKVVGIGAVIGIMIALGLGVVVFENQSHISALQEMQRVQTERNKNAQCTVATLFLQFEAQTTADPSVSKERRRLQTQAYDTLRQISHDLECPKG